MEVGHCSCRQATLELTTMKSISVIRHYDVVEHKKVSTNLKDYSSDARLKKYSNSFCNLKRTFSLQRVIHKSKRQFTKHQQSHCSYSNINEYIKNNILDYNYSLRNNTHEIIGTVNATKKDSLTKFKEFCCKVIHKITNIGTYNHEFDGNRNAFGSSANDVRIPASMPSHIPLDRVPGVIGLRNHGNTCFINAILQCLSHTDVLAEYFVLDQYKADLSRKNKSNSKKYGTKGEITEQLALLLKAIWSCQYNPEMSTAFKSIVDKYGSQYRGNSQHDAQEFLLWLLDKVHEDLNQATNKKYKTIKVSSYFST